MMSVSRAARIAARTIALVACASAAWPAAAQPVLKASPVAELATGLSRPHDAAFSPDGTLIYVTDMGNNRVRVLEAMTLESVGTFGEGELSSPHDAAFDRSGRLLVADTGNDRVAIYEVRAAQAKRVGELGGLSGPEGVAVAPDGRVFVTNTSAATLSVFRNGRLERTVGARGSRDGEFANPHGIEVAPDGSIYVVDSGNDRVQVFDADLAHRATFGAALALRGPKYLAFDAGRIWLADEDSHRVLLLDGSHRAIGVLGSGRSGRSATEFRQPEAVLARAPHVWVIDTYNDRILLLRVD